jgi:hypothetical protein
MAFLSGTIHSNNRCSRATVVTPAARSPRKIFCEKIIGLTADLMQD